MDDRSNSGSGNRPSCIREFKRLQVMLKQWLAEQEGPYTIYFCTDNVVDWRYLYVTIMFMGINNCLKYKLIAFKHIAIDEPVSDIARHLQHILYDYGIADKIFCITTNVGCNVDLDVCKYLVEYGSLTYRGSGTPLLAFCAFNALHNLSTCAKWASGQYVTTARDAKVECAEEHEEEFRIQHPWIPEEFYRVGGGLWTYPDIVEGTQNFDTSLRYQRKMQAFLLSIDSEYTPSPRVWTVCNTLSDLLNRMLPSFLILKDQFPSSHRVVEQLNEVSSIFADFLNAGSEFYPIMAEIQHTFNTIFCTITPSFIIASVVNPQYKLRGTISMLASISARTGIQFEYDSGRVYTEIRDLFNLYSNSNYADLEIPELIEYENQSTNLDESYIGDPTSWWYENVMRYPTLARMARDLLTVPASIHDVYMELHTIARDHINRRYWERMTHGSDSVRAQAHICVEQWAREWRGDVMPQGLNGCNCRFVD